MVVTIQIIEIIIKQFFPGDSFIRIADKHFSEKSFSLLGDGVKMSWECDSSLFDKSFESLKIISFKWTDSIDQFISHTSKGVDITPVVIRLFLHDFRGHINWRAVTLVDFLTWI